ncbi:MAG: hypothetical protein K8S16_05450 [Bacteroidales bacterium]|nr:hypothetical protein [Bacteroidales bacterium]
MFNFRILYFTLVGIVFMSCAHDETRFNVDINNIEIGPVSIKRYGQALFEIDKGNLQSELKRLRIDFPVFLDGDLEDVTNINRIRNFIEDTLLISVYKDYSEVYPDLVPLERSLFDAFRHYRFYYPEDPVPEVFSYISGFDYEHRIQFYNDKLLIALDMYLGGDYPRYKHLGIPHYIVRKFQPDYVVRDCMYEMALNKNDRKQVGNELLNMMVNEGKLLWFIKAMAPDIEDEILFDYTMEQLEWIQQSENFVWAFMIENEMLYKSNPSVNQKFIYDSPFTSFFGKDSPPRLGWWVGFRIVEAYMEQNRGIFPNELFNNYNAAEILKRSKYKPR